MTKYFFVAKVPLRKAALNSRPCDTLDDALRGAKFMLGNGAARVSIVDSHGSVVLPWDDARLGPASVTPISAEPVFA